MEWSDETAVARVKSGDADAFRVLVERHSRTLFRLAFRMTGNEQDAEDVVQEAMLRAFRFCDALRGEARPWLLAIVRNCCHTWRRSARPQQVVEYVDEVHGRPESGQRATDADAIEASDRAELRAALDQLLPEHREAIVLREIEGLSYKEIASVTGAPIGTVMSRLARARRRLQEALGFGAQEAS
jgi:RNA polymerase sigma-70 factor (ECF subfamily)